MPNDPPDQSQLAAYLESLGRLGDPQAVPALLFSLRHNNPLIRQVAATSLGHIADASAMPGLLESLRDPQPKVRQAAAWSLGQIGQGQAVDGLLKTLQDSHADTRRAAAWALGQLRDKRALPGLEAAERDPDQDVRRAAASSLSAISGARAQEADGSFIAPLQGRWRARARHRVGLMLLAALGVIAVGGVIALAAAVLRWNRALGPELVTLETSEGASPADALPTPAGEPVCGGPSVMMLLVVGSDAHSSDYATGFADVIRVIRIDFVSRSVVLLAVPRDLWVPIPGLDAYGIAGNRIKTAYTYGNRYAVPGGGPSLLAQTLALNFGLHADHYVIISFAAFEAGIDALGGIDVYLPEPVESQAPGEQGFAAGWQHMDGETALSYARFRPDNSSDLARIERQTQVIAAVREKMFDAQNAATLPDLVASLQSSVLTDLSPSEISSLTCLGRLVEAGDIQAVTIAGEMVVSAVDEYGYERLLPNSEAVRQLVRDFNSGRLVP